MYKNILSLKRKHRCLLSFHFFFHVSSLFFLSCVLPSLSPSFTFRFFSYFHSFLFLFEVFFYFFVSTLYKVWRFSRLSFSFFNAVVLYSLSCFHYFSLPPFSLCPFSSIIFLLSFYSSFSSPPSLSFLFLLLPHFVPSFPAVVAENLSACVPPWLYIF